MPTPPQARRRAARTPDPVRVGIIGVGNMGSVHARSILDGRIPGAVLAAVCDTNPARLDGYGEAAGFTTTNALLKADVVDAVVIATPHPSHVELGIAACRAGCHLLVEKPIGIHTVEAERLLAEPKPGLFAMMFNQRTDPCFQKVRDLIRSGTVGTVRRFTWTITDWFRTNAYYRSSPWRATWNGEGGGMLLNQGVHNIDLLQWIFGLPKRVRAVVGFGQRHPIAVEDEITAILEYESGMTGTFISTSGEAPGINRLEIAGENGLLILDETTLTFRRNEVPADAFIRTSADAYARPPCWDIQMPLPSGRGSQHNGILRNFIAAIREGEPLIAPGEEGIASLELINALLMSAFEDRPVDLPIDAARYVRHLKQRQRMERKTHP